MGYLPLVMNNALMALLTLGEGWHNNHHRFQSSARNGLFWWEFDPSYWVIRLMGWLGLAWGLRPVPPRVYAEARQRVVPPGEEVAP